MYTLYILRGSKGHLYTGITSNLDKRLLRHKTNQGAEFTFRNKAFTVVYTETFQTYAEARRRENQIKGWRREKKENLIKFGRPVL